MIALLRGRGADPNHTNGHGRSPLDLARLLGDYDAARFFADLLHPPTPTKPSILEMLTAPSSIRLRIDQANSLVSRSHNVEGSELAIEWSDVISFGFVPYLPRLRHRVSVIPTRGAESGAVPVSFHPLSHRDSPNAASPRGLGSVMGRSDHRTRNRGRTPERVCVGCGQYPRRAALRRRLGSSRGVGRASRANDAPRHCHDARGDLHSQNLGKQCLRLATAGHRVPRPEHYPSC